MPHPFIAPPATPSELFDYILANHTHPTTLLICWPRKPFFDALVQEVRDQPPVSEDQDDHRPLAHHTHPLLRAPLMQVAVSRHIHVAFVPSVAHLRSYLVTFSSGDSGTQPPPPRVAGTETWASGRAPLLLAYGLLELHRDGSEWSAQGLNTSAAGLVQAAARNGLRAAIVEPRKTDSPDEFGAVLGEDVPLLNGSTVKDDGTWPGRVVSIKRVLDRWFVVDAQKDEPGLVSV
ncbi:hypothetical protein HIM_00698 [Hirsutella minnesotensis 3608]|nr:hypothetical protein HIM_00698 [Hirsutella minnesotensis 3608]